MSSANSTHTTSHSTGSATHERGQAESVQYRT